MLKQKTCEINSRFGERSVLTTFRPRLCQPQYPRRPSRTKKPACRNRKVPTSRPLPTRPASSHPTRQESNRRHRLSTFPRHQRGPTRPTPNPLELIGPQLVLLYPCICKVRVGKLADRSETYRCIVVTILDSAMIRRRNRKLIIPMTILFLDKLNCQRGK